MIRWNPNTELASLHNTMDRLFDDFFGRPAGGDGGRQVSTYFLPLDVKEVGGNYQIEAAVPGFKPEEVDVTFSDGVLTIRAEHTERTSQEHPGYLRREIAYGNYQRSIQLPGDIKEDSISAQFEDGMLTVTIPKVPRPQPKKIQVSATSQKQVSDSNS